MIHTETVTIRGKQYRRTYSDTHMLIRDGVEYEEALDRIDTDLAYQASDTPLPDLTAEEALAELLEVLA